MWAGKQNWFKSARNHTKEGHLEHQICLESQDEVCKVIPTSHFDKSE